MAVFDPRLLFFILPLSTFSGKPSFTKKQADLFFPPDFADDFPVAMQVFFLGVLPFSLSLSLCMNYHYICITMLYPMNLQTCVSANHAM